MASDNEQVPTPEQAHARALSEARATYHIVLAAAREGIDDDEGYHPDPKVLIALGDEQPGAPGAMNYVVIEGNPTGRVIGPFMNDEAGAHERADAIGADAHVIALEPAS